jgi:hypothetical protein
MGLGGLYEYVLIDTPQATRWLAAGVYVSCVTHPFLAGAIEELTGRVLPPPQRRLPLLGYADDALIFQVEGYETLERQITGDIRRIRVLVDEERFTFGLLRRLG